VRWLSQWVIWKWKLPEIRGTHTRHIIVNQLVGAVGWNSLLVFWVESRKPPSVDVSEFFICMSSVSENHAPTKKRWLLRLFVDFPVIRLPCHVSFDSFRGQNKGKCWFCLASIRWIEVSFTPAVYCSLQHLNLNLSQDRPLRHNNCHWISCQFFSCFFCFVKDPRLFLVGFYNLMWHWCVSPLNEQIWQDIRLVCGCLFRNRNQNQNTSLEGCSFGDDHIKTPWWRWWVHCLQDRLSQDLSLALIWLWGEPWHWLSEGEKLIGVQGMWIRNVDGLLNHKDLWLANKVL